VQLPDKGLRLDIGSIFNWMGQFPRDCHRPIDRLAAAIFVNSGNPEGRLMALFTAYFDASGSEHHAPLVIVSGFVANYGQWKAFEGAWNRAHTEAGVSLPFHMAEFMSACTNPQYAKQTNAREDYVRLAQRPDDAEEFMRTLTMAEVLMMSCGISCILPISLYNQVNEVLDLSRMPPYALAARMCIKRLHDWENLLAVGEPVEYVFEEGDFGQGKFTELMVDEGEQIPIYKKKKDFAGLQAADHYAWEQFNFLKRREKSPDIEGREILGRVIYSIPKLHVSPDLPSLLRTCELKGIEPRRVRL
jgi:hypothetical protein